MDEIQAAPNGNQSGSKDGSEVTSPLPPSITIHVEGLPSKTSSSTEIIDADTTNSILRLVVGGVIGASGILAKAT